MFLCHFIYGIIFSHYYFKHNIFACVCLKNAQSLWDDRIDPKLPINFYALFKLNSSNLFF